MYKLNLTQERKGKKKKGKDKKNKAILDRKRMNTHQKGRRKTMDSIENINQNYRNQFFDTQRPEPKNEMDKETFLTLFIEGLKNQDPTEPMEHSEMMAQMTNLALMESVSTMKRSKIGRASCRERVKR